MDEQNGKETDQKGKYFNDWWLSTIQPIIGLRTQGKVQAHCNPRFPIFPLDQPL
jgi:hypothetical protein